MFNDKEDKYRYIQNKLTYDVEPIFKYIKPNNNDKLSQMSGLDLQDLIILMDDFYLKLRSLLGFNQNITFGLELEFENAKKDQIDWQLRREFPNNDWQTRYDGSLDSGAEINSPILKDTKESWENLNKVCCITEPLASIGRNSGGHIHVGTQALGDNVNSWFNFMKMWSVYENVIFRFVYGTFLTARPSMSHYSMPIAKDLWKDYKRLKEKHANLDTIIHKISCRRYQAVNFGNVSAKFAHKFSPKNTIEFRCPNGSLDAVIWQNNVNLFVNMLCYCKSLNFNDDLVQKRRKLNLDKYAKLNWYDEIYLEQALEFCDMIFSNNFDKIYFLKQYLKSFEICENKEEYPKTHILTKK